MNCNIFFLFKLTSIHRFNFYSDCKLDASCLRISNTFVCRIASSFTDKNILWSWDIKKSSEQQFLFDRITKLAAKTSESINYQLRNISTKEIQNPNQIASRFSFFILFLRIGFGLYKCKPVHTKFVNYGTKKEEF